MFTQFVFIKLGFWGFLKVPYADDSKTGPRNPILIMKAPTLAHVVLRGSLLKSECFSMGRRGVCKVFGSRILVCLVLWVEDWRAGALSGA